MGRRAVCLSLALVVTAPLPWRGSAGADTIYLVNGRKIHTESATIQDGRVVFTLGRGGRAESLFQEGQVEGIASPGESTVNPPVNPPVNPTISPAVSPAVSSVWPLE